MKARIFSIRNAPVSVIGFLLFLTIMPLGCGGIVNRVTGLDPILLTQDDLQRMGLRKSERIRYYYGIGGPIKEFHVIAGFEQRGYQLKVQYWLFDSWSTAKKAAAVEWIWTYAAMPNFHPELNPKDVIGNATWRRIHKSWREWEKGPTDLYFVKYNLLVSVRAEMHPSNRLQFARDAARKIEAEIETVLLKNGKIVISKDKERGGSVRLWDVETGNLLKTLKGHKSRVTSVSFSSDSRRIVSGSWDKTVRLWDVETGDLLKTHKGHEVNVTSVSFSPDGKTLASGSWDNTVRLWDAIKSRHRLWGAIKGRPLKTLRGHTGWVLSVSFSPDGKTLASGGADGTVRLWNADTGNLLKTLPGHAEGVVNVSFSPDGKTLASGSVDGSVWLWDADTGNLLKTFEGHNGNIESVSFLPDGKMLVGGSLEETILLWGTSWVK